MFKDSMYKNISIIRNIEYERHEVERIPMHLTVSDYHSIDVSNMLDGNLYMLYGVKDFSRNGIVIPRFEKIKVNKEKIEKKEDQFRNHYLGIPFGYEGDYFYRNSTFKKFLLNPYFLTIQSVLSDDFYFRRLDQVNESEIDLIARNTIHNMEKQMMDFLNSKISDNEHKLKIVFLEMQREENGRICEYRIAVDHYYPQHYVSKTFCLYAYLTNEQIKSLPY